MNPLQLSKESFAKLRGNEVNIELKGLKLTCIIIQVYLAANPPNLPGSYDVVWTGDSEKRITEAGFDVPNNLSVLDATDIELK